MSLSATVNLNFPDASSFVNTTGLAPLTVDFSVDPPSGGVAPYTYVWDFGDGSPTEEGSSVSHIYSAVGSYPAKCTISDSSSPPLEIAVDCPIVVQGGTPLSVTATATPSSGAVPLDVQFSTTAAGGAAPYSYAWNFGDGGTGTGASPMHTYASAGDYTATVTVTDSKGTKADAPVAVTVASAPTELKVGAPQISPNPSTVNLSTAFFVPVSGGAPPYRFDWHVYVSGIPNPGNVQSFQGIPSARGTWNVSCKVTDSKDTTITSPSTKLVVNP